MADDHKLLLTLVYDNLLSFVFFLYSQPLYLAYLLYFSPYIIQLISFLFPLLLSTYSLLLVLFSVNSIADGEQLGSLVVVATIGDVFEWEFETMGEVDEDPDDQMERRDEEDPKGSSFVPQTPDRTSESSLVTCSLARRAKQRGESLSRSGSTRINNEMLWDCNEKKSDQLSRSQSEKGGANGRTLHDPTLRSCVSMRKDKEWRRTLGCKLYEEHMATFKLREERRETEGAEEMDLLWEAYESNTKRDACIEEEEEEKDDDDESVGVQLCCLKAFRLSSVKMTLGVSRPIAKISKVFKGVGLFHRSGSRRSRNKVESKKCNYIYG